MVKSQGEIKAFASRKKSRFQAFTLIECLVALSILSLIFLSLSGIFSQSQKISQRVQGRQEVEWQVFLVQLENQFQLGSFKSVEKGELVFNRRKLDQGKPVLFSIKFSRNTQSVYLSDNGGMEPMLTQVSGLSFQREGADILFTVTFTNGEKKIGKWTIP